MCQTEGRALLTNNVRDFVVITRRWAMEGRSHGGLVFISDSSMPRSRQTIGHYVRARDQLLNSIPADSGLRDRIHCVIAGSPACLRWADPGCHSELARNAFPPGGHFTEMGLTCWLEIAM